MAMTFSAIRNLTPVVSRTCKRMFNPRYPSIPHCLLPHLTGQQRGRYQILLSSRLFLRWVNGWSHQLW